MTIKVLLVLSGIGLLSACATVNRPTIKQVNSAPSISNSIQPESAKSGLKRKVAIARFSNETRFGQSYFLDSKNDRIGKQALDILSAKLFETDKFIILERADLAAINNELAIGALNKIKNMADYLIVGSVTELGRRERGEVGVFSRTRKQESIAKVHIRLVDVYSGQVIYTEEGEGTAFSEAGTIFGVGERAGYDSSLSDKALNVAITNLSSHIIENLLDKPWKAYILDVSDGSYIISGGKSQNIQAGDKFDVLLKGKTIKNPQTNMMITLPGKKIAQLRVLTTIGETVENEASLCELISGNLSAYKTSDDFSKLYIQEINK